MKKLLVLSAVTVATCVYARVPQLNSRHDTLISLAKMVAGAKTISLGMLAVNVFEAEPHEVDSAITLVRKAADRADSFMITLFESVEDEPSITRSLDFVEKFGGLMPVLSEPPAMPENAQMIEIALPLLHRLLTEQTLVEGEHVASALQVVAEMEQLSGEWKLGRTLLDDAQVERWQALVTQLSVEFLAITQHFPAVWRNYQQQTEGQVENFADYLEAAGLDEASLLKSTVILRGYEGTKTMIKLLSSGPHDDELTMIEQFTGGEIIEIISKVTNLEDEHRELTLSYLSGDMPSRAFAQQYGELLHKYTDFFSAEQIQKAEQALANLAANEVGPQGLEP